MKFVASTIEFCSEHCPESLEGILDFIIETFGSILWFVATLVSFVLVCVGIIIMVMLGYTVGKRWAGEDYVEKPNDWSNIMTDCAGWPKWLTIGDDLRIYPAHIGFMILSTLFFTHPEVAGAISKWLIIATGSVIAIWLLMNIIQQWARDLGHPLGTDHDGDTCGCCCH